MLLKNKARLIRKWILISTTEAGSGHPTSSLSATDFLTVLFDKFYTYDLKNPLNLANDRFLLSKGHASPVFYALYAAAGGLPFEELKTLRKFGSRLEGHPTPNFPYTEAATGSLGQGFSVGAGMAIGLQKDKRLKKKPHVYVVLGDGELAEGQNWEAANFAGYYHLDNLIAIADINRLGQSQETMFGHKVKEYANRFKAFGWEVITINGHNFQQIEKAFQKATHNKSGKPVAIIAKTFKGAGISFLQNKENWHGKPLPKEDLEKALKELGPVKDQVVFKLKKPTVTVIPDLIRDPKNKIDSRLRGNDKPIVQTDYPLGTEVGTREVYGKVLTQLAQKDDNIIALDAEVKNSTYSIDFMKAFPDRFVECFIAEQNMVSMSSGLSRLGKNPWVSTFAAFLTRAFDQIRMARLSHATIHFVGSHAGVSIGEDGASQMGLEDFAMFGVLPDSIVLHPSDAVSTEKLLAEMDYLSGISYLRTLRPKTPVLYKATEDFPIGGSKVLKKSNKDVLTLAATGITVFEALKAYEELKKEGISVRVIDCYSIKPVDKKTLVESVKATKNSTVVTIEDHFEHGGLGDFVLSALSDTKAEVYKMAVTHISRSGKAAELLDDVGISTKHIIAKVKQLLSVE